MALQLIIGPSGYGKTYYANRMIMDEAVQNPDKMYYVVVPEQLNLSMQQDFLKISPTGTLFNVDVVSFERLAERILSRCGLDMPELVDDTGKCLVLRKVAGDIREDLTAFKRPVKKAGFIQLLKSMLSELLQYNITDERLHELSIADKMPIGLKRKLGDMYIIYHAFNEAMDSGEIPKETILSYVTKILSKADFIKDCTFLFDGFTGFTPIQEIFVQSLIERSKMVYATVTMDRETLNSKEKDNFNRFFMSSLAIGSLYRCAADCKAKVMNPVVLTENHRTEKEDLLYLEKNLFKVSDKTLYYEDEVKNIHLASMENPLEEVQCVAEEIYHLIRDEGYRYREIAVVTGNMDAYIPHVTRVFGQAGFSYYMDTKKNVQDTPLISYILYAIRAIWHNADYESMFGFLKTGIILNEKECSILENYVLAKGIRGFSAWNREWKKEMKNMAGYTMEGINEIREKAIENLLPLRDAMKKEDATVRDVLEAIVTMMQEDNVYDYVESQKDWYEEHGDLVRAELYDQLYEKVLEVFDQFEQTLGRQKILVEEYHDILLAGFAEIKAGVIPATSDCIIIGDMQRTRVEDIKVLFFLGLNEGNIPSQDTKGDLFNERERELLASEYEVELTPNVETKQSFQKFYFYLTLTKASEKLYLSYPEMDNQGGGLNPSSYLREIETLFPCLEEEYMETGQYYINDATMLNVFATELRKIKEEGITGTLKSVAGDLWSRRENRPIMEEMIDKAFFHYEPENIGASRARSLYGATIHTSPTRLEQEATCPFSQFLKYGIGLTERDVYEVSQKDIGSVYHMALEQFFKVTKTNNLNWVELTKEERSQYIDSCMENISENYKDSLFKSSAKNKYFVRRISSVLSDTVDILAKQIQKSGYTVKDVEIDFSGRNSAALDLPMETGSRMLVSGRVDRMDVKESDNNIMYAKVIDYKTGSTTFDATLAYNGLQLQLIYMDAANGIVKAECPDKDVRSGGFAYYHVKDQYIETDGTDSAEQLEAKLLKSMEMSGVINLSAEPDAKKNGVEEETLHGIQKRVKSEAIRLGKKICKGDIEVSPYKRNDRTGCTYCPYRAVCGFDVSLSGYEYRNLKEVSKDVFSEVRKEEQ